MRKLFALVALLSFVAPAYGGRRNREWNGNTQWNHGNQQPTKVATPAPQGTVVAPTRRPPAPSVAPMTASVVPQVEPEKKSSADSTPISLAPYQAFREAKRFYESDLCPNPEKVELFPSEIKLIEKTNAIRKRYGLKPLKVSKELMDQAFLKSKNMAITGVFDHFRVEPNPYKTTRPVPYGNGQTYPMVARENIGWNYGTPEAAMAGWEGSGGHLASIIAADRVEIGVGVAKAANGQLYWTQVFHVPKLAPKSK